MFNACPGSATSQIQMLLLQWVGEWENEKENLVFRANVEHMEGGVREPGSPQPREEKQPLKGMTSYVSIPSYRIGIKLH